MDTKTVGDVTQATREIIEALKPLASKIGESAEVVYHMAVKDALISGYVQLAACSFFGVMGVVVVAVGVWAIAKEKIDVFLPCLFASVIPAMIIAMTLPNCLHNLLNPEYMALRDLLNHVK